MLCICFCDILPCKSSCSSISQHWILVNCIHCLALRFMREVRSSQQLWIENQRDRAVWHWIRMVSWGRGLKLTFSLQLDWCDKRFSFEHRLCFEVVAERRQLYFGPDHSSSSAQTLQREPSAAMTRVIIIKDNNCKRWHSYRGKIVANCSIMHSIIIYREGLDLTLPILPCLQFFGHGGEEYSKCRIEKWNCMLATSTGWRMSSRVESARQCILRPLNVLQRSRVNCRAERGTDGDVHIKTG